MKNLIVIAFLAFATQSLAADTQVTGIEIVNFGIYAADITSTTPENSGIGHNVVTNQKLAARTATIPAQIGVHFGVECKVLGSPAGAQVTVRRVTRFPSVGLQRPGAKEPTYVSERDVTKLIGNVSYSDYSIDDSWEAIPGKWRLEFWIDGRKLAEQEFTLVKP